MLMKEELILQILHMQVLEVFEYNERHSRVLYPDVT